MELYQIKKPCTAKEICQQNKKAIYWMREIFKNIYLVRSEYSKYIRNSYNSIANKEKKNSLTENDRRHQATFF